MEMKQFFEAVPPGVMQLVEPFDKQIRGHDGNYLDVTAIELHCKECNGERLFEPSNQLRIVPNHPSEFLTFVCRNCAKEEKTFAFRILRTNVGAGQLIKYGEIPAFGPPTPAKLISLAGSEREYFLKGRRAELQGLGIAAFAYYRRVVENQKAKIIGEILRVAQKLNADSELINDLQRAMKETQFSTAVDAIKHGIPQALMINGYNPLTLLHSALSEGLHAQTDEQCLELATSIRVLLTELVERISNAVKEDRELSNAVTRLANANSRNSAAKPGSTD